MTNIAFAAVGIIFAMIMAVCIMAIRVLVLIEGILRTTHQPQARNESSTPQEATNADGRIDPQEINY